ncbi:oxidative stress survival, Svf1-like protein [Amylocarpus encephaloides]|uniref:Oxidative stress survival, Svf1-like protein n=1 Tax=Amylocarpus encephaloides TaxID=45428 RepID=A0A9P7YL14_9HELO|nr:oxidative stress survival, Svf1-like protein [Amylocarpus encephaloides]
MNWFKQTLANAVGTQEPEYGPEAIRTVTAQAEKTPYTELTKDDLKWKAMQSTNVETQTFYAMSEEGKIVSLQMIYNNVAGMMTTCQLNVKLFDHKETGDPAVDHLWLSDPLENHGFDDDMKSFYADGVSIALNEAGDEIAFKSARNELGLINLVFKRVTPGFQVGENGTTYYGTDPENPWGEMRHRFWPRCTITGNVITPEKTYDFKGHGCFIHAIQGMKPHHAAAKWDFVTFQTPTYSAIMMEFTTPASYASTKVTVGGIAKDGEIISAGAHCTVKHPETKEDPETFWPEPITAEYQWEGKSKEGDFSAILKGPLGDRMDRIDILSHIPGVIKSLVGGVVGTRPYVYQFYNTPRDSLVLSIKNGDNPTVEEQGTFLSETSFVC